ncbi:ATP-binding protein [Massilia sp. 9096]|uniref:ATP-binding response regulator n=1 Tax=Massilia sp. 9096 TaxID=1500894 RepID=UPI00068BE8FA|nr:ATP-binding protein [Massilia sp. 9096]
MRVRTHLSLLAAAVFLPVILGSALAIKLLLDAERRAVLRSMQEMARATVLTMDQEITAALASAQALSTSALLAHGDFEGFYAQARAADAGSKRHTALLRADARQVFTTLLPYGAPIPLPAEAVAARMRAAMMRERPTISNLFVGSAARTYVLAVSQPVWLADGRRMLLNHWIYAADMNRLLPRDTPASWLVSVFDREGGTIARGQRWQEFVGKQPNRALLEALRSGRASTVGETRDGVAVQVALARSPLTGWSASVAVPSAEFEASAARAVALTAVTLLCAVALAVLGALLFARRLLRATEYLGAAAEGMAEGRLPPPADLRITELNALQKVLHAVSTRLIRLDEARRHHLAEAEEARRLAEAQNRAKDEFLAMLGHELRNPLGAISSAIALIQMGAPAPAAERAQQIIGRQARHLAHLVDELLDANRVLSGRVQLSGVAVDLGAAAREVALTLQTQGVTSQHAVELDLGPDTEPTWVGADPHRLQQIIGNLVENAAKYTQAGGHIRIRVRAPEGAPGMGELAVIDDGKGIDAELLPRIWEVFVQGKVLSRAQGGLGIGLAVVKSLVEQQGGTVAVDSPGPQRGSTFTVLLPLMEPGAAAAPETNAAPAPGLAGRRVLVVEDNADLREMMCAMLQSRGCTVFGAADGRSALALAPQARPEIGFVDIDLPDISGHEVARALLTDPRLAGIRLVAVTGYGQLDDVRQALAAGFARHLKKPVRLEELEQAIADIASAQQG